MEGLLTGNGGAVHFYNYCNLLFDGNSIVTFNNNSAADGGAIDTRSNGKLSIRQIKFNNNTAIYCCRSCEV